MHYDFLSTQSILIGNNIDDKHFFILKKVVIILYFVVKLNLISLRFQKRF